MPLGSAKTDNLERAEVSAALQCMSPADWIRAYKYAKLRAQGLVGWTSDDLVQEAATKLLSGERVFPRGIATVVVLKNAMRSIGSNTRKKDKNGPIDHNKPVTTLDEAGSDDAPDFNHDINEVTPEDILVGKQRLDAVLKSVSDDDELGLLVIAWADGLRGDQAAQELGIDKKACEALSKRLTRRLATLDEAGNKK